MAVLEAPALLAAIARLNVVAAVAALVVPEALR